MGGTALIVLTPYTAERVAERTEGWVLVEFRAPPAAALLDHLDNAGRCVRVDDYVHLDAPAMAAWWAHPTPT